MKQTARNVSPVSNAGRNTYVVTHITDALLKLLKDKPISDISICELCSLTGTGRASFYWNFESREDILKSHIRRIFREWTDKCREDWPLSLQIKTMFSHFESHRDFYEILGRQNLIYMLKDILIEIYGPHPGCPKSEAYASAFVTYSIYGWIEVWFQRGMQESAEEMAGLFQAQGL